MGWNLVDVGMRLTIGVSLWLSCAVYLLPLKHRKHFGIRLFCSGILVIAVAFLLEGLDYGSLWSEGYLFFHYLCTVAVFSLCVQTRGFEAWYGGVWALLTHEFLYELGSVAAEALCGWERVWLAELVLALCLVLGYAAVALTIARWMPEKGNYPVGPRQMCSAWFLCIVFETLFLLAFLGEGDYVRNLMAQLFCLMVLYLQNTLFKKSRMQQELDTIQLLWHQQQEQYELSQETIRLVNQKCHDMKHQVQALRRMRDDEGWEKQVREVEDSIRIYGAIVKTGNEILDVILTEKSLLCESRDIQINCVANGKLLEFIDVVDLYTMLGNALDNAIECVGKLPGREQRMIDLMVFEKQRFLVVQMINPLANELKFEDNLPVTTKPKDGYHGYGLKSIRHTIEKYQGHLSVEIKDGCFYLKLVAPLPEGGEK